MNGFTSASECDYDHHALLPVIFNILLSVAEENESPANQTAAGNILYEIRFRPDRSHLSTAAEQHLPWLKPQYYFITPLYLKKDHKKPTKSKYTD